MKSQNWTLKIQKRWKNIQKSLSIRRFLSRNFKVLAAVVVFAPFAALLLGTVYFCVNGIALAELAFLIVTWQLGCLGVTIGLHRFLTHSGFKPKGIPGLIFKFLILALANTSAEGPAISWVASHRKHHAFSDIEGDPHSPHHGWDNFWKGFWHAHVGWMFRINYPSVIQQYKRDLDKDRLVLFMDRTYFWWLLLRFVFAYLLFGPVGILLSLMALGLTHQSTFAVNSICHLFGRREFTSSKGDQSTDNFWVMLVAAGEGGHRIHHSMAYSVRHSVYWWQPDLSWYVIWTLSKLGVITDLLLPTSEQIEAKRHNPQTHIPSANTTPSATP
ncbi:MAG: acyl-CoA desaturase [bacterium]